MPAAALVAQIKKQFEALDTSDEVARRDWAVRKAISLGRSGKIAVHEATGIALTTIRRGVRNIESGNTLPKGRQRRSGGGRHAAVEHDPGLVKALYRLLEPQGPNARQAPLHWTCKSARRLAAELTALRHSVGATTVLQLLKREGFCVEANRRTCKGQSDPDRDAQFQHIHHCLSEQRVGQPALVVEMYACSNPVSGNDSWSRTRMPAADERWELVGITRKTIAFTVAALHEWWRLVGGPRHPKASSLLLVTDSRVGYWDRTWKAVLQRLSDVLRIEIDLCLAPPATCKWTRLECQLIARLIGRVAGRPAFTHKVKVNLIGASSSQSASPHEASFDARQLESLGSVYEQDRFAVNLRAARFHGEWNYLIVPRRPAAKVSGYFSAITYARK
jgi:hypothetical protein